MEDSSSQATLRSSASLLPEFHSVFSFIVPRNTVTCCFWVPAPWEGVTSSLSEVISISGSDPPRNAAGSAQSETVRVPGGFTLRARKPLLAPREPDRAGPAENLPLLSHSEGAAEKGGRAVFSGVACRAKQRCKWDTVAREPETR